MLRAVTVGAGIIPTRMGTSRCFIQAVILWQDHPHAYGDKLLYTLIVLVVVGSSPRVWGQVRVQLNAFRVFGIIPTRMGTSAYPLIVSSFGQDHPHAYGDKNTPRLRFLRPTGSSPRVWGQAKNAHSFFAMPRIIPTRMGTRQYDDFFTMYG